jgi:hypothetical protein
MIQENRVHRFSNSIIPSKRKRHITYHLCVRAVNFRTHLVPLKKSKIKCSSIPVATGKHSNQYPAEETHFMHHNVIRGMHISMRRS